MNVPESASASIPEAGARQVGKIFIRRLMLCVSVLIIACLAVVGLFAFFSRPKPLPQMLLADGRILQIEGVSYGTKHRMGRASPLAEHLSPWLPSKLNEWLRPKQGESKLELGRPALVVWVTAINPRSGTNVDCQGIRTEFVDESGELLGEETSNWFGSPNFWRVAHIFYAYPRDETDLTFQVTPWRTNRPSVLKVRNPNLVKPLDWTGLSLPQTNKTAALELVLSSLIIRTNGGPKGYWQTRTRYWEPVWELRQEGKLATGWGEPEWLWEDPLGNRGKFLGVRQPVLRLSATVYPQVTNSTSAVTVATLPRVNLPGLKTNIWWNQTCQAGSNEFVVMGICAAGTHTFCDGKCVTSFPVGIGATVKGGAPSGWMGQSQRINPIQVKVENSHYTPAPTAYVRAPDFHDSLRLGLRLRDTNGVFWTAEPEADSPQDIHAFLLPTNVMDFVPELVLLKPLVAEFLVRTSP